MVCFYTLMTVPVLLGDPIFWTLVIFPANTGGNVPTVYTIYTNILVGLSWRWNFKYDFLIFIISIESIYYHFCRIFILDFIFLFNLLCVCVCMYICACINTVSWESKRGRRIPWSWGYRQLYDVWLGVGNQTQVFCKYSQPLSYPSSPSLGFLFKFRIRFKHDVIF